MKSIVVLRILRGLLFPTFCAKVFPTTSKYGVVYSSTLFSYPLKQVQKGHLAVGTGGEVLLMKKLFFIFTFLALALVSCKKDDGVDSSNDTATYYAFVALDESENQDFPYGIIDRTGQIVIPCRSSYRFYFSEGLGCQKMRNHHYIDKTGNTAIVTSGNYVWPFYEGLAVVCKGEYSFNSQCYLNCGYIDKNGQYVTNSNFLGAGKFSEGLAAVGKYSSNGEYYYASPIIYGFIDKTGQYVIEPQFDKACCFSEGLAFVGTRIDYNTSLYDYSYGIIDKTGRFVLEPDHYAGRIYEAHCFSEGLAAVRCGLYSGQSRWGFLDCNGQWVVSASYQDVRDFHDGLAAVYDGNRWGFIDKTGQYVISPVYDEVDDFSEGLACCNKSFYIDKTGQIVLEPHHQEVCSFFGGLAAAKEHGLWGYIDKTGQFVIEPQFLYANDFQNIDATITDDVYYK